MTGVGFARNPNKKADETNEIHLWKPAGETASESYCGELKVEKTLSNKGMTQVTSSSIEQWKENDQVCSDCVEQLAEQYNG